MYKGYTYLLTNVVNLDQETEYPPCETLRRVRKEKDLTQSQLAILIIKAGYNVNSICINRFELGKQKPWPAARRAIAHVLNMSEKELFPEC